MSLDLWSSTLTLNKSQEWIEIQISTDRKSRSGIIEFKKPGLIVCRLPFPKNQDMMTICMSLIGLTIARSQIFRGGVLIHGVLVKTPPQLGGGSILLAGSGSVGKTTAANRLPPPWSALSDDTSFIFPSGTGSYQAHPWPTWSNFYSFKNHLISDKQRWDVQSGLSLKAIFFLRQSDRDFIEPLPVTLSLTFLFETIQQVSRLMTRNLADDEIREIHKMEFAAAKLIALSIPAYTLHLSLTGSFWETIEQNLTSPDFTKSKLKRSSGNLLTFSYSGPSMNPILSHPDILEVTPYADKKPQSGDVICFRQPEDIRITVHRIVVIINNSIITQGDNNSESDPFPVQPENIIGQVTAAWRFGKPRIISGGVKGRWIGRYIRFRNSINRIFSSPLHKIYQLLCTSEISQCLLSKLFHFKVFKFKQKHHKSIYKILLKNQIIGIYDHNNNLWKINRPWRLFINESNLPGIK
jgi:SynChlorMet cassette protein ScmC